MRWAPHLRWMIIMAVVVLTACASYDFQHLPVEDQHYIGHTVRS